MRGKNKLLKLDVSTFAPCANDLGFTSPKVNLIERESLGGGPALPVTITAPHSMSAQTKLEGVASTTAVSVEMEGTV